MIRPSLPVDFGPSYFEVGLRGESVVVCTGELDLAAGPSLRASFDEAVARTGDRVVVDLAGTTFIDCSAVREIVRARTELHARGDDLSVRGMPPVARRLLTLLGIELTPTGSTETLSRPDPVPATIEELVRAWRSTSLVADDGAGALAFDDPAAVVAQVVAAASDPSWPSPGEPADLVTTCRWSAEADPEVVVLQLIALGRVARNGFAATPTTPTMPATRSGGDRLDDAIDALVAAALEELVAIGLVDTLTGLRNRRALDQDLAPTLATARRRRQCVTVVVIDVEGLKAVNDRYGHAAGDDVLREVAASLTSASRAGDQAYRVGGDEFVLVLPDMGPDDIEAMVLRTQSVTSAPFTWGCAWTDPDDRSDCDLDRAGALLHVADQRMLDFRARERPISARGGSGADATAHDLVGQIAGRGRDHVLAEQATGLLAQYFGVAIADARDLLLSTAAARGEPPTTTSALLVSGVLRPEDLAVGHPDVARRSHDDIDFAGTTSRLRGA